MRLTDFKVNGFKSFADLSAIKIGAELTGIVGPNGCGKSNIIDAIRWTLGESRGSALRVTTTDDYLFGGSSKRTPADWCSVELKFDNSQKLIGGMWGSYAEIAVKREYTRDEKQEYSINGTVVRRRDVLDLFRGTGVSPRAYGVVEQGMVAHIAESSPDELRAFIEESANISQYKARRHETQNRLKAARENLLQVDLILEGLAKNERSLKRQARAAKQYREFEKEHQQLKCRIAIFHQHNTQAQMTSNHARIASFLEKIKAQQTQDNTHKNTIASNRQTLAAQQANSEKLMRAQSATQTRIAEINKELEGAKQRQQLVNTQLSDYQQSLADLSANIAASQKQAEQLKTQAQSVHADIHSQQQQAKQQQQHWQQQQTTALDNQQQLNAAQARVGEAEKNKEAMSVRQELYATQQTSLTERIAAAQASLQQLTIDTQPVQDLKSEEEQLAALTASIDDNETQLTARAAALEEQAQTIRTLETEISDLQTEVKLSNDMLQADMGNADDGTHQRLAQKLALKEKKWAVALDAVLGVYARAMVVDNLPQHLKAESMPNEGQAVVAWQPHTNPVGDNAAIKLPPLLSALSLADAEHRIMQNWLSRVYLAEDDASAQATQPKLNIGESIVTASGVVYQSHSVFKHRSSGAGGGFNWQKKLDGLQSTIATKQQQHSKLAKAQATQQADYEAQLQAQATQRAQREAQQQQLVQLQIEFSRAEERRQAQLQRQQELQQTLAQLQSEQQTLTAQQEALTKEEEEWQAAFSQLQGARDTAQSEAQASAQQLEQQQQALQESQQRISELKQQHAQLEYEASTIHKQIKEMEQNKAAVAEKMRSNAANMQVVDVAALEKELRDCRSQQQKHEDELANAQATHQQLQSDTDALQAQREAQQETLAQLQKQLSEQQILERELSITAQRYADEIESYDFAAEQMQAWQQEAASADDEAAAQWQTQLKFVEEKRESFGAINFMAEQDLQECQEKLAEICQQKDDINEAIDELANTIKEIDSETKGRLHNIYTQVNETFSTLFYRLFNGGEGRLEMIGDDILEAGFELKARPPGKRLLPIRTLSGGEKSIAALAFIFAIMKINPPPFCLLDEVDAALDDARTDRFIDLLKEVANDVQCLVITHNKNTIAAMKRLIGITQEELGVSKIVTVTLEDALRVL